MEGAPNTMVKPTASIRPASFFALTYLLSWLIWIPLALSHFGIGPLHVPEEASNAIRLLGVLMPATAALILTALTGGRAALRALLGRLALWCVGWRWWGAAALAQPALLALAALAASLGGGWPPVTPLSPLSTAAFIVNVVFLLLATLGEEIGWRGVALPALQTRRSALASSCILALLWGVWHVPFWLLLDTFDQFGGPYLALNFMLGLPLTVYITWIFNHTRSSLLMPVVLHVTFNIVNTLLLPVTLSMTAFGVFIILEWIVGLLVVRKLTPVSSPSPNPASKRRLE